MIYKLVNHIMRLCSQLIPGSKGNVDVRRYMNYVHGSLLALSHSEIEVEIDRNNIPAVSSIMLVIFLQVLRLGREINLLREAHSLKRMDWIEEATRLDQEGKYLNE